MWWNPLDQTTNPIDILNQVTAVDRTNLRSSRSHWSIGCLTGGGQQLTGAQTVLGEAGGVGRTIQTKGLNRETIRLNQSAWQTGQVAGPRLQPTDCRRLGVDATTTPENAPRSLSLRGLVLLHSTDLQ